MSSLDDSANSKPIRAPRVSVIMATYKQADLIEASIQSVLAQDYQDFELVVIVDGSPDNTAEVVAKYGEPVRTICQSNQGLPGARNSGLRAARGEIITILDGDDLYEPNFLSSMVGLLDANPGVEAAFCAARFVDVDNRPLPQVAGGAMPAGEFYTRLLRWNFMVPMCMVAYRTCYERLGWFDETIPYCNDWDMWLKFARLYRVTSTGQVLGRYRVVPGSMSTDPRIMLDDRLLVLERHFGAFDAHSQPDSSIQRMAFGTAYLAATMEYWQIKEMDLAYQNFKQAFRQAPELLGDASIFAELAWGGQPRGYRGHFASVDLEGNGQVLLKMLARMLSDPSVSTQLARRRRSALASAYRGLGMFAFRAGMTKLARRYLLHGLRYAPRAGLQPMWLAMLLKTLIGASLTGRMRDLRQKLAFNG